MNEPWNQAELVWNPAPSLTTPQGLWADDKIFHTSLLIWKILPASWSRRFSNNSFSKLIIGASFLDSEGPSFKIVLTMMDQEEADAEVRGRGGGNVKDHLEFKNEWNDSYYPEDPHFLIKVNKTISFRDLHGHPEAAWGRWKGDAYTPFFLLQPWESELRSGFNSHLLVL